MDSMVVDSSLDQDVDIDSDPAPFAAEMDPDDLDLNQSSRRKGKNKKRAFDDMTWKGYVSVEDLQAQKQATQPPKGWRPVLYVLPLPNFLILPSECFLLNRFLQFRRTRALSEILRETGARIGCSKLHYSSHTSWLG